MVPVEINGVITLNFVLDTGASETNIPADVALTLYRTGTIKDADFLPGQTYRLADGSKVNSSRFVLRSLKIGQHRITNVAASIGNVSSSLLLGQSFLEQLGAWGIDSQRQVLTLGTHERQLRAQQARQEATATKTATVVQLRTYQAELQAKITNAWKLPPQTKDLHAEVLLIIDRAGKVEQVRLVQGSGNAQFDESLQQAIEKAQPLPPLPEDYTALSVRVTLRFRGRG